MESQIEDLDVMRAAETLPVQQKKNAKSKHKKAQSTAVAEAVGKKTKIPASAKKSKKAAGSTNASGTLGHDPFAIGPDPFASSHLPRRVSNILECEGKDNIEVYAGDQDPEIGFETSKQDAAPSAPSRRLSLVSHQSQLDSGTDKFHPPVTAEHLELRGPRRRPFWVPGDGPLLECRFDSKSK